MKQQMLKVTTETLKEVMAKSPNCPACQNPMYPSVLTADRFRCFTPDCNVHWVTMYVEYIPDEEQV